MGVSQCATVFDRPALFLKLTKRMFVSLTHLLLDYGQVLDVGQVKSEHRHPHGDNASVIGGRRSSKNAQQRTHPSAMTLGKQKRVQIYPRRKHSPDAKTFTGRKTPIGRKNTHRTQEHPSDARTPIGSRGNYPLDVGQAKCEHRRTQQLSPSRKPLCWSNKQ